MHPEDLLWLGAGLLVGALAAGLVGRGQRHRLRRERDQEHRAALDARAQLQARVGLEAREVERWESASKHLGESFKVQTAAALERLVERSESLEDKRQKDFGSLRGHLEKLDQSTRDLSRHSTTLASALRGSARARGRWGETTLRNLVELSGLAEHVDFIEQHTTDAGLRPDLVVRLPGGALLPIDAKVPLAAFLDAEAATEDSRRQEFLRQHARDLRQHARTLARKNYPEQLPGPIDFTVLFLPGDHFLAAAAAVIPDLMESAMGEGVLITTPVTLLALLRTVRLYWRGETAAEDARELLATALELHRRSSAFGEHLSKVGKGLEQAVRSYNAACGSFDRRLLPWGRRLEELSLSSTEADAMTPPAAVEVEPQRRD